MGIFNKFRSFLGEDDGGIRNDAARGEPETEESYRAAAAPDDEDVSDDTKVDEPAFDESGDEDEEEDLVEEEAEDDRESDDEEEDLDGEESEELPRQANTERPLASRAPAQNTRTTSERGDDSRSRPPSKKIFGSAEELMLEEVQVRLSSAGAKLLEQLNEPLLIKLLGTDRSFLVNPKTLEKGVEVLKDGGAPSTAPECTISISEHNLLKVAAGELNPQLVLLTDKTQVLGKAGLAVYFFNLVAPR